jgi:hypothetical protein
VLKIGDFVPAPKITEICRLHIERHNDYDFCDQRTTTTYCGPAFKFINERYVYISQ